jgi:hypothetical protein
MNFLKSFKLSFLSAISILMPSWRFFDKPGFEAWVEWRFEALNHSRAHADSIGQQGLIWQPLIEPIHFSCAHIFINEKVVLMHLLNSLIERAVLDISEGRGAESLESAQNSESSHIERLSKAVTYFVNKNVERDSLFDSELQGRRRDHQSLSFDWRICVKSRDASEVVFEVHGQNLHDSQNVEAV